MLRNIRQQAARHHRIGPLYPVYRTACGSGEVVILERASDRAPIHRSPEEPAIGATSPSRAIGATCLVPGVHERVRRQMIRAQHRAVRVVRPLSRGFSMIRAHFAHAASAMFMHSIFPPSRATTRCVPFTAYLPASKRRLADLQLLADRRDALTPPATSCSASRSLQMFSSELYRERFIV
jgi:hypothetical protein